MFETFYSEWVVDVQNRNVVLFYLFAEEHVFVAVMSETKVEEMT